ncbi:MAG: class I SAM-dependent methyltransferase [Luteitalea sp.]|nr:class I SAM-dependent methyltransferase [Luteitalea sp.]
MDETFSRWLAIREPLDAAARSAGLTRAVATQFPHDRLLRILDLGSGTGSNARYLIGRLPPRQRWVLVDHDADLLAEVPVRMAGWGAAHGYQSHATDEGVSLRGERLDCHVTTRRVDLNVLDPELFAGQDLVTGSALLDLVSDRWLQALASASATSKASVLFALTYNGGSHCAPPEPEDARVLELMNSHQHGDKGFGPAAGPEAADRAVEAFERVGYAVRRARSDWVLTPQATELQVRLLSGWREAAAAMAPDEASRTSGWLARRLAHVAAGRSRVVVGHEDVAAWPAVVGCDAVSGGHG